MKKLIECSLCGKRIDLEKFQEHRLGEMGDFAVDDLKRTIRVLDL